MISNHWIELRKENWNRLESAVKQAETSGLKTLSAADLREFGLLYRQAAADLSAVRSDVGSRTLDAYLNRLVSRAHNFVYTGDQMSPRSVWRFMAHEYPRLFHRLFRYTATATLLFLAGAIFGTILALVRPEFAHAALGPQMMDKIEHHQMWTDSILGAEPQASSNIMTNNISVCFITYATGLVFGIYTVFLLVMNGFDIGIVATVCAHYGLALSLWSFVAAHGALELPSIFIAGGAGLRLASGILFPGFLRRRDSVALGGSESIRLLAGTVPLLVIAGILEGFLSPSKAPLLVKFSVSAVLLTGMIVWLSEGWRRPIEDAAPAETLLG
jgi:uncharacterized membrane protein SpoIIM required for sporulation